MVAALPQKSVEGFTERDAPHRILLGQSLSGGFLFDTTATTRVSESNPDSEVGSRVADVCCEREGPLRRGGGGKSTSICLSITTYI